MNTNRRPWGDARVRQAVHLAYDRTFVIQGVLAGNAAPSGFFWGPWAEPQLEQMPGYRSPKDPDRVEAKRLLTEAGFPNGFDTKVLTRADDPGSRMEAEMVQAQ